MQQSHDCGQDVNLLGYLVLHLGFLPRFINDYRHTEPAQVSLVESIISHVGMVAGQHEDGVLEPALPAGTLEEAPQCHIGIADALMNGETLLRVLGLVLFRNDEGVMG